MRLRKLIFSLSLILMGWNCALAATPPWTIKTENYQYNMTVISSLFIEGEYSMDSNDILAAFVNDQCRGIAHPELDPNTGKSYVYLMAWSNQAAGETMTLKVYDASSDQIYTLRSTLNFSNNSNIGSSLDPFLAATNYAPENLQLSNNTIAENMAIGSSVGTLSATDVDNNPLTYSLVNGSGDNNLFNIEGATLKTHSSFDYEVKDSYTVQVIVEDGHNGSQTKDFTITIQDRNEAPVIHAGQNFTVNDESTTGTIIGNLKVSDDDNDQQLTYSIQAGNTNDIFEILPSGSITISQDKKADFETKANYQLTIKVTDNGTPILSDSKIVSITVIDVNFDPTAINLSNNHVNENLPANTEIGILSAVDIEPQETFTFSLPDEVAGNEDFKIEGNKLITARAFNYESQPVYNKRVKVVDSQGGEYIEMISIHINDVNENPVIAQQEFNINEEIPLGSFVNYVTISDVDDNQTHSFIITGGNTNAAFKLDKNTGELTVNNASEIDFEKNSQFTLTIKVTDNGIPALSDTKDITVNILDVNVPPSDILLSNTSVDENLGANAWVGNITGVDPEPNEIFTFSLEAGVSDNDFFEINQLNQLVAKSSFDYETRSNYRIRLTVVDRVGELLKKSFTLFVNDINETPQINQGQVFNIEEDKPINSIVGYVKASDPDRNQSLNYSIKDGNLNNAFKIDKQTGEISVNNPLALDFETTPLFSLEINVEDDGEPSLVNSEIVTINLENVSYAPETLSLSANEIDENQAVDKVIGELSATDPEPETFTFSLPQGEADNDNFKILNNRYLASNKSFNYESQNSYSVNVLVTDGEGETLSQRFSIHIMDVNEHPTINAQTFEVEEEKPIGTIVGVVMASDIENNQSLVFEIIGGNDNDAFKIDRNSGELTVNNPSATDFENNPVFNLNVRITDNGSPALSDDAIITINILDVNYTPVTLSLSANLIDENEPAGTFIGEFTATDPESEETFTFSLPSGEKSNDLFSIDQNNKLVSARSFNFEESPSYPIKVTVTDSKGSTLTRLFTIVVTNVNESPILNDITFSIEEEKPVGSVVGYMQASDVDRNQNFTYSIISGNTADVFKIDPQTGEISVNNPLALDYETYTSFTLTVEVTDDGANALSDQATVTINVIDINHIPSELNLSAFEIDENSDKGTVIGQLSAIDPEPGETFEFTIPEGELDNDLFAINSSNQIVSKEVFNFESRNVYTIRAKVTDSKGAVLVKRFTINVTNVNEQPVINDQTFEVHEDKKLGSVLGYVQASDVDRNQNLQYEIISGNTNNAFAIQATSGELTVNSTNALNFEEKNQFTLEIRIEDDGSPAMSDIATITVNILDINYKPDGVFLDNKTIFENQPQGTLVGNLASSDIEPHEKFTFTLEEGMFDNHLFNIVDGTRLVSNVEFNYETKNSYSVKIKVTDLSGGSVSEIFQITIRDVNEKPELSDMFFEISEDKQNGSVIGYLSAHDVDRGQTFSYKVLEGNNQDAFKIFPNTGEISVNNNVALNYDQNPEFILRVAVTDNGIPSLSDEATLTISIKDINFAPYNLRLSYDKIPENSPEDTRIGVLTAQDTDLDETFTYSILGVTDADQFFHIDDNVLYSNLPLNFEERGEYPITIQVTDSKGASSQGEFMINVIDVNENPVIEDQQFTINEDKPQGTTIDYIKASDVDDGQLLNYSIISGNSSEGFQIDGATGQLSINNPAVFDYEGTNTYNLTIEVTDNGNPALSDQAIITVDVIDVNYAPSDVTISRNHFREIEEGVKFVGKLRAYDREPNETFSFSLPEEMNDNNRFVISNDSLFAFGVANYEEQNLWIATVEVIDSKGATLQKNFDIVIDDVNEQPVIKNQSFIIEENAQNDSPLGTVIASDPDNSQNLRYSIIGGNESGVFRINPTNGEISIANRYALDYETSRTFTLAIEVADSGSPTLKNSAVIVIAVKDNNEWVLEADNLFTPNGDGINDTWQIETPGQVYGFSLIIFNTAGEIVHQTKSYDNDWDGTNNGKKLAEGTYYYMFRNRDGSRTYKGFINLKR